MRIVLDSNILVRCFSRPCGPAHEVLQTILLGKHRLILSNEMLVEVARVLRYPSMMMVHGQDEEAVYDFAGSLKEGAEVVVLNPLSLAPIRDRNDIFVLQTVLSGEADVLCTCDRDFFHPPASVFLASRGIDVLTDTQLMRRLKP